jgi:hypothetical protein
MGKFEVNFGALAKEKKAPLYLDCDGVIIDTPRYTRDLILNQYGVDMWTHKRENVEDDKKVAQFYKELNWFDFLQNVPTINNSIECIKKLEESELFLGPTIYTCVNSHQEIEAKTQYFDAFIPNASIIFTDGHNQKNFSFDSQYYFSHMYCNPFLIDDDTRNLNNWKTYCGYAIPFDNGKPNNKLLGIQSLTEILEFVSRDPKTGNLILDFDIDEITGYVLTKRMKEYYRK